MRSRYSLGLNLSPSPCSACSSLLRIVPLVKGGEAEACESLGGHTVWEQDREVPQGMKENRISTQALELRWTMGQN